MVRKGFLAALIIVIGTCGMAICAFAEESPAKSDKEKSELARIMGEIDKSYKAVEQISGYYKYTNNDWNLIAEASVNIVQQTKIIISKFSRPDDKKYQDLNKTMLAEAEKMLEVVKNKDEQGSLEDSQWQVRRLRQTCALCHKHLGIHIYPQLYPGKKNELQPGQEEIPAPKEPSVPKDW
ncbi:MAG: hypothetical protein JETT_0397 [Candidatus Jettenia ecosi]|uniref:Uncharacterized protein n=1 Tax=Candidatus Jettenia ecosi TaxID=2494326 RepID=A0A533QEP8_9BACT|nr:MAG: hypothetical protein JETT_0397 [Candidatus Jettenia ecosi]